MKNRSPVFVAGALSSALFTLAAACSTSIELQATATDRADAATSEEPAPTVAEPPVQTPAPTPAVTATPAPIAVSPTPTVDPLAPWIMRADALISIFENSTTEIQYGYVSELGDGRGVTAGRAGFTSATHDLLLVVSRYLEANPDSPLAQYLPALQALDQDGSADTSGLLGFAAVWTSESTDPVMRQTQDQVVSELYFEPSQVLAQPLGVSLPLTMTVLYDTAIQHGTGSDPDGLPSLIAETTERMGGSPADGIGERKWLREFLAVRAEHLAFAADPETRTVWAASVGRVDALRDLLNRGIVQLDSGFTVTAFGGEYQVP